VVVGVVADATQTDPLTRSFDQQIYASLAAHAPATADEASTSTPPDANLLVRTGPGFRLSPATLSERLRPLGVDVEAGAGFVSIREQLSWFLDRPRFNAILFAIFAGVALVLALVGLYGVVAQAVDRRAREMAIRIAVGASATDVRRLILSQGMLPVAAGILLGLAAATGGVRVISRLVYLVDPVDAPVFAAVPVFVVAVTLAAIWIPARRAARVDPAAVIRLEC
jgi:ABC-type antimicrobial peptide transport system permease subunit